MLKTRLFRGLLTVAALASFVIASGAGRKFG